MGLIHHKLGLQFASGAQQAEGIRWKNNIKELKGLLRGEKNERRKECEEQTTMKRKGVKVDDPWEWIKHIYMVNDREPSEEPGEEK